MRWKARTTRTTIFVQRSSRTWPTMEDQPCNCVVTTAYLGWRSWLRIPESIIQQILQRTRNRVTWTLSTHPGSVSVVPATKPPSVAFNTLIAVTGATLPIQRKSRLLLRIWSQHQASVSSRLDNLTERLIHPKRDNTIGTVADFAELAGSYVGYHEAQIRTSSKCERPLTVSLRT